MGDSHTPALDWVAPPGCSSARPEALQGRCRTPSAFTRRQAEILEPTKAPVKQLTAVYVPRASLLKYYFDLSAILMMPPLEVYSMMWYLGAAVHTEVPQFGVGVQPSQV